jgi:hypothetical protein
VVRIIPLAVSLAALTLAACSGSIGSGNDSTSISFSSNDSDGNVTGGIDKSGNLKINAPGFNGDVKIPKLQLGSKDFEMNGVHLYPGSTIGSINVDAQGDDKNDDGKVKVTFTSPAAAATVRDWLKERLNKAGFTVTDAGTGLTGKTDDGKPFKLDLTDQGAGKASGTIEMGG